MPLHDDMWRQRRVLATIADCVDGMSLATGKSLLYERRFVCDLQRKIKMIRKVNVCCAEEHWSHVGSQFEQLPTLIAIAT